MLLAEAVIQSLGTTGEWWVHVMFEVLISLIALFLILLILVQRGRGGGLAGALGGMGGQSAFGTRAGDTFTWITYAAAAVWIILAMVTIKTFTDPFADRAKLIADRVESEEGPATIIPTGVSKDAPGDNANDDITDGVEGAEKSDAEKSKTKSTTPPIKPTETPATETPPTDNTTTPETEKPEAPAPPDTEPTTPPDGEPTPEPSETPAESSTDAGDDK